MMREVRAAPKWKMAVDWEGLTVGEKNGDGQKRAGEGRGGSVAGVDERHIAWSCAEESEGEKRRGEQGGIGLLFEAEAARQRRGVRGWSPCGGREQGREAGGLVSAQQRQPVGNDPGTLATGGRAWPLKIEEVGRCRVGPMTQCRSATTRARQPRAGGRGRSKQRRWGATMWAPRHSADQRGTLTSEGPGRQRRGCDGGGRQSGRRARAGAGEGAVPTSGPVQRVGPSGRGREEREGR
jgi:hypothetical protein